jgi:hypothetical protein
MLNIEVELLHFKIQYWLFDIQYSYCPGNLRPVSEFTLVMPTNSSARPASAR